MFEKYNKVLRELGKSSSGEVPYRNTILMLISGVMKLRKVRNTIAQETAPPP